MFNYKNKIYNKGIAWGNNEDELTYATNTIKEGSIEFISLYKLFEKTVIVNYSKKYNNY